VGKAAMTGQRSCAHGTTKRIAGLVTREIMAIENIAHTETLAGISGLFDYESGRMFSIGLD